MSHYNGFETTITDQEALVRALCRCSKRESGKVFDKSMVEVHKDAVHLYGYHGDRREQTAHVIIRRNHVGSAANDIGFVKEDGKFQAIISDYDSGYYDQGWLTKLFTYYNVECSKMAYEAKGIEYTEDRDEAGRIRLRAKFNAPLNQSRIKTHS